MHPTLLCPQHGTPSRLLAAQLPYTNIYKYLSTTYTHDMLHCESRAPLRLPGLLALCKVIKRATYLMRHGLPRPSCLVVGPLHLLPDLPGPTTSPK